MTHASGSNTEYTTTISVFGDVAAADFPIWIKAFAAKLGLHAVTTIQHPNRVDIAATGPAAMLDTLAVVCTLGPATVMVERVDHAIASVA